jgi:hypothetical protein
MLAFLKWASMMKQFILYTIFSNVLLFPRDCRTGAGRLASPARLSRFSPYSLVVVCVVVVDPIPTSLLSLSGAARPIVPARNPRHRQQTEPFAIGQNRRQ